MALFGDSDILCIEWDERSLRIVDASVSRGNVKVRAAVHAPIPAGINVREPAAFGEFMRRALGEHRIRTRRVIVDVPRQDAVLNLMTLPAGSTDELAAMIHIQVAKELPFAKDQAVIDFAVVPGGEGTSVDVWVTAVRNHVIDYYRQVVSAAGLRLERIGLRPYANLAALNSGGPASGRTLLVDIGPSLTEIDVIRDGRLMYSRAATVSVPPEGLAAPQAQRPTLRAAPDADASPGDQAADRAAAMDTLLVEVSRTVGAYRATDPSARIERIVLAGTAGLDDKVVAAFEERFNAPAQLFEVPEALRWKSGKGVSAAPFSAALGLASSSAVEPLHYFNLLAPKEPEAQRRERIRQVPYKAAAVVALVAAAAAAAYYPVHERNKEIDRLDTAIAEVNTDKKAREELLKNYSDLEAWEKVNVAWLDHLRRIADAFPDTKEAYLTKMDFTADKGEITLELVAKDKLQATKLVETLSNLKEDGKYLYIASPGNPGTARDPAYPFADKVYIKVKALQKETKKKRR